MESAQPPDTDVDQEAPADDGRPFSIVVAGNVLLIVGAFAGLVGAVLIVAAIVTTNPAGLPAYLDVNPRGFFGIAGVVGLILVAYGTAGVVAGFQVMRRKAWARPLGIGLAAIGAGALVIAVIRPGQTTGVTPVIFAPVIAALAYAAVALAAEGRWFEASDSEAGTR